MKRRTTVKVKPLARSRVRTIIQRARSTGTSPALRKAKERISALQRRARAGGASLAKSDPVQAAIGGAIGGATAAAVQMAEGMLPLPGPVQAYSALAALMVARKVRGKAGAILRDVGVGHSAVATYRVTSSLLGA